jgi:hypothetical protein
MQLILACLSASDETLLRLSCRPGIAWPQVVTRARLHRVLPLVLYRLQASGAAEAALVSEEILARLRHDRRLLVAQAARLDRALATLLAACAQAGVPIVVLKGVTLARFYPAPWLRPRSDIDVLIHPRDWPAAHRVLGDLGYALAAQAHVQRPLLSRLQAPEDRQYMRAADETMIEVHADFLSTGLLRRDDAAVWRRMQVVEVGGLQVPALAPGDAFLQAAAHIQRHRFVRLLWFYDLLLLLRAEGAAISWPAVARQAERTGVLAPAYSALGYVEDLFGYSAPAGARAALRPNPLQRRLHAGPLADQGARVLTDGEAALLDAQRQGQGRRPYRFDAYAPPAELFTHLLLSGNVWPKLAILGRRLVPREEWLRYYGPARVRHYRARLALARLLHTALAGTGRDAAPWL